MARYDALAERFCAAIKKLAGDEEHRNNLESYLSHHFPAWMEKYASYPEGLTAELEFFGNMEFHR
jgi:hypothetical protein